MICQRIFVSAFKPSNLVERLASCSSKSANLFVNAGKIQTNRVLLAKTYNASFPLVQWSRSIHESHSLGKMLQSPEIVPPTEPTSENEASEYELLLDKYKRALAEIENSRKRCERLVEEAKSYAIQGFCKDLLEVADILNIAVESLEKEVAKNDSLKNIYQGINMTKNSLLKTFAKNGIVKIEPLGQKFDPNLHEAVFEVAAEASKYPPGHVSQVLNIGYSLNNRPVRPAKVGVVKNK